MSEVGRNSPVEYDPKTCEPPSNARREERKRIGQRRAPRWREAYMHGRLRPLACDDAGHSDDHAFAGCAVGLARLDEAHKVEDLR